MWSKSNWGQSKSLPYFLNMYLRTPTQAISDPSVDLGIPGSVWFLTSNCWQSLACKPLWIWGCLSSSSSSLICFCTYVLSSTHNFSLSHRYETSSTAIYKLSSLLKSTMFLVTCSPVFSKQLKSFRNREKQGFFIFYAVWLPQPHVKIR